MASSVSVTRQPPPSRPLSTVSRSSLESGLLWFAFVVSGLVWIEPAPFDILILCLIGVWILSGLRIPDSHGTLAALLGLITVAGLAAVFISDTPVDSGRHVLISIFLFIVAIGLAAHIARDPKQILSTIMSGYIIAALIATVAGTVGYFELVGGAHEIFTERERARGTFKDPNVFGPFLVVPLVYLIMRHLAGKVTLGGVHTALVVVLSFGLLLSFSRGAWGNMVMSLAVAIYLTFVSSRSNSLRIKVLGLSIILGGLAVAGLIIALSFDAVADMMSIRGHLIQSYDTNERFAGAALALKIILANPIGIGAASFTAIHGAEPHNVYLYMLLSSGWIGGFAYLAFVLLTLALGLRATLRSGPLQEFAILFFATFLATAIEGIVVDTDHWRHFYLLAAAIWGIDAWHKQARNEPANDSIVEAVRQRFSRIRKKRSARITPIARTRLKPASRTMEQSILPESEARIAEKKETESHARPTRSNRKGSAIRQLVFGDKRGASPEPQLVRSVMKERTLAPVVPHEQERTTFGLRAEETRPTKLVFGRRAA